MGALIEVSSSIVTDAARFVEGAAQNIANISTPGYKRRIEFERVLNSTGELNSSAREMGSGVDFTAGKIISTNAPYDLAIVGDGFFVVRSADGTAKYTRDGRFSRDAEGRLLDGSGGVLQAEGGDLLLRGAKVEVTTEGMFIEDGQPTARVDVVTMRNLKIVRPSDGGGFSTGAENVEAMASASVKQGAIETSNADTGAEMVAIMAALRRAEAGQRLSLTYDDLMGRVISTFGQN